jgi:hypothetical protein
LSIRNSASPHSGEEGGTMELEERQEYQEEETDRDDLGTSLVVLGAIFLLFDLFCLLFVGEDIRAGSSFFSIWMIAQTGLGVVLIGIGFRHKWKQHVKDDA